jgi:hypothetical protein
MGPDVVCLGLGVEKFWGPSSPLGRKKRGREGCKPLALELKLSKPRIRRAKAIFESCVLPLWANKVPRAKVIRSSVSPTSICIRSKVCLSIHSPQWTHHLWRLVLLGKWSYKDYCNFWSLESSSWWKQSKSRDHMCEEGWEGRRTSEGLALPLRAIGTPSSTLPSGCTVFSFHPEFPA